MADVMFKMDDFEGKNWGDLCFNDNDEDDSLFNAYDDETKVNYESICGDVTTQTSTSEVMDDEKLGSWQVATKRKPRHMMYVPKSIFHLPPKKRNEYYEIQQNYGDVRGAARTMGEGAGAVLERNGWIPRRLNTIITEQMYKREMQQRSSDFRYVRVKNNSTMVHYVVYQRRPKPPPKDSPRFTELPTKPSFTVLRHQNLCCD